MRRIVGLLLFTTLIKSWAFSCYLTLAKDSCWTNYNVTVKVLDAATNKVLTTVDVPKGQPWRRSEFRCHPSQELKFRAVYSPVFWKSEEGVEHREKQYLTLPGTIVKSKEVAWNVPLCFPEAFANVPTPPEANGACQCDLSSIPPVKP